VEPGSPFKVRASQGKCLSIGPDKGYCTPPPSNSDQVVSTSFLGNPWWENPDGSVPAHKEEREENLPIKT
jgi:hypothetical protein